MSIRPSVPPSRPPPHVERLHTGGRNLIGLWNNVFVTAWRAQPTAAELRLVGELERDVEARFPDGFLALAVIPVVRMRLDADARAEAERLATNHSPRLIAQVIEGKGFLAAAARSMAVGITMLNPQKTPMKIFGGIEPAAAWLATFLEKDKRATAPRLLAEAIRNTVA